MHFCCPCQAVETRAGEAGETFFSPSKKNESQLNALTCGTWTSGNKEIEVGYVVPKVFTSMNVVTSNPSSPQRWPSWLQGT